MKQEDWTQQLRDKLADYEESVPDDLWAGIEARLIEKSGKRQSARTIPLWGRWAVAASLVGLLLGGGYLLWTNDSQSASIADASVETTKRKIPMKSEKDDPSQTNKDEVKTDEISIQDLVSDSEPSTAQETPTQPESPQTFVQSDAPQPQPEQPQAEPERTPKPETTLPEQRETEKVIRELDAKIAEAKRRKHQGTSFSLFASNDLGSWSNRNGVLMSPNQLANYDYSLIQASTRQGDIVYLYNYEERQKHYQPISFGLTVKIPISSRISLSSGIVYTRLRSDFTNIVNGYELEKQQTLYYLGIPLSAQYLLWGYKGLKVYATAGGQVDFCLEAKMISGGTDIPYDKDRAQFSMQGALGLQYDIIPQLGIYVEPGVKYYFNNGSKVRNFFKDKPTNFNLQLGLRLNL